MPFLPKIYYYFNCFRKYRPPTRVWETVSRAEWSSSADAADNPLFAHMPYLWNLRPEHHRIWANPKQTQTIQWPRVPPNGMACKVITNDQFLLRKQARKKSYARDSAAATAAAGRQMGIVVLVLVLVLVLVAVVVVVVVVEVVVVVAVVSSCCCHAFWLPFPPAAAHAPAAAAAGSRINHHGKNHLPAGKHHASEGRRSPKIAPRKCLT